MDPRLEAYRRPDGTIDICAIYADLDQGLTPLQLTYAGFFGGSEDAAPELVRLGRLENERIFRAAKAALDAKADEAQARIDAGQSSWRDYEALVDAGRAAWTFSDENQIDGVRVFPPDGAHQDRQQDDVFAEHGGLL